MYKTFLRNLEANANREPFDISYHCDIQVNDIRYRLRLYREGRHLYPVQAIRLEAVWDSWGNCEKINGKWANVCKGRS